VRWARFPDCAPLSDGPSDDGFQLTLSVSKFTYLIIDYSDIDKFAQAKARKVKL